MAIFQISKIQIRRGRANGGTGFPQLASGEMGWAIDTQELFIGNGAVSEGAPAVGNTKILTYNDFTSLSKNVLSTLIRYTYKANDNSIVTGNGYANPVIRTLQDRLDDLVTVRNFGVVGDGVADDTIALQRAINQLFLNDVAPSYGENTEETRITLVLPAGVYKITNTLHIPSYASIVGAGIDKTIINYIGEGSAIEIVNDLISNNVPANINTTLYINQPRYINLSNMTIHTESDTDPGIKLNCMRNSTFSNLKITGTWITGVSANSRGIDFNVVTALITCEHNTFNEIEISGFYHGVYAKQDINYNKFDGGNISTARYGFSLGVNANTGVYGEQYGPRNTIIDNIEFFNIDNHAIYLDTGSNTNVLNCALINVGGSNQSPTYPQIVFNTYSNHITNLNSDRYNGLSGVNLTVPYVSEVSGHVLYQTNKFEKVILGNALVFTPICRLPMPYNTDGIPTGYMTHTIDYTYHSTVNNFNRRGTITLVADSTLGQIHISDEYDTVGISNEDAIKLEFVASLIDSTSQPYTGAVGQKPYSILLKYKNTLSADVGVFNYSYSTLS